MEDWELKHEIMSWIDRSGANCRDWLEGKLTDPQHQLERNLLRDKIFNYIRELKKERT